MIKYNVLIAWILDDCSCQYSLLCQVSFEYPVSTVLTSIYIMCIVDYTCLCCSLTGCLLTRECTGWSYLLRLLLFGYCMAVIVHTVCCIR